MSADVPLIIVNPKSGKGTSEQKWASMACVIREQFGPFDCEFTRARGDGVRLAREAALQGRSLIVACGGDGTISEVANGILEAKQPSAMGVLPGGTGGDFRRTLGIPSQLAAAARRLRHSEPRWMDAGKLQYVDHSGRDSQRYFVNTASFGMSGAVASRANRSEKILGGTFTYAVATLRSMVAYEFPEVLLQWDDQPQKRLRIATVCVANGPSFGGGMKIAPDAKINDGLFDMVIIGDMKLSKMLFSSHKLYWGSFHSLKDVAVVRAQKIEANAIGNKDPILLEVDGETPGRLPAVIEIMPQALQVRC